MLVTSETDKAVTPAATMHNLFRMLAVFAALQSRSKTDSETEWGGV